MMIVLLLKTKKKTILKIMRIIKIINLCFCDSAVPPGPPVARVTATTDHSIDVEWDPPADNGGGEILGYHVDKVRS